MRKFLDEAREAMMVGALGALCGVTALITVAVVVGAVLLIVLALATLVSAADPVTLVHPDTGERYDCGRLRINAKGHVFWRIRVPCGPLATPRPTASPSVTSRPTASPRVTHSPRPTAVDACAGGCWVDDFSGGPARCVRPCPQ